MGLAHLVKKRCGRPLGGEKDSRGKPGGKHNHNTDLVISGVRGFAVVAVFRLILRSR
jgi:hypothetical protein